MESTLVQGSATFAHLQAAATQTGGHIEVRCVLSEALSIHCSGTTKAAHRLFRKAMRRLEATPNGMAYLLPVDRRDWSQHLAAVDQRLAAIAAAPLSGRAVERILGITGEERRRWTKDGRLPVWAKAVAGRSHRAFALPLYAVDLILRLADEGETLRGWRLTDAQEAAH